MASAAEETHQQASTEESCHASSDGSAGELESQWTEPTSCSALCALILDDRRYSYIPAEDEPPSRNRRRPLPPALYAQIVAPFLRFEAPLPNMLYAFGGRNQRRGPLNKVEMFDTWHGCWVSCPAMPTRRAGSAAAVLPDGRFIVVGGYNEHGIAEGLLASCDIYDPRISCWQKDGAPPLARARWGHGCAPLGGKVYVVGGCSLQPGAQQQEAFMETLKSCEVYDPAENKWSACCPLQIARSGSRVVVLDDRYLAAIGGCDDVFGRAETQPTVEIFDVLSGQWSLLQGRLTHPRTTAAAAAIDGHRVFVVGGAPSLASAEVYRVDIPQRGSLPTQGACQHSEEEASEAITQIVDDMPDGRMGCQAALISLPSVGGQYPLSTRKSVVIIGGERCDESTGDWSRVRQYSNVPVFDIESGQWRSDSPVPAMASTRTAVALCVGIGRATSANAHFSGGA